MKRLPINVMNFSAGRDTKLYEAFEEYYNAYVNGKASIGNVSFAEADKDILDAYKKEIEVNSAKCYRKKRCWFSGLFFYFDYSDFSSGCALWYSLCMVSI